MIPPGSLFRFALFEMIISEGYLIRESAEKEIQKFTFNLSYEIEFGGRLILVAPNPHQ